jgi:hypothetical protein
MQGRNKKIRQSSATSHAAPTISYQIDGVIFFLFFLQNQLWSMLVFWLVSRHLNGGRRLIIF